MAEPSADGFLSTRFDGNQQLYVFPNPRGDVLAAASILIEPKCLRGGGSACHVCEVLRDATQATADSREALLQSTLDVARSAGCYKVIIDARGEDTQLLRACGFEPNSLFLQKALLPPTTNASARAGDGSGALSPRPLGVRPVGGGCEYVLRPLEESDGPDAYVSLLAQLSQAPPLSPDTFRRQLRRYRGAHGMHRVFVIENASPSDRRRVPLVGCASLIFERLPLTSGLGALVARIEDVVVDESTRGSGLGRALIGAVCEVASACGAQTATLNCSESNLPFYRKCGFDRPPGGETCFAAYLTMPGVASHGQL